MSSLFLIISLLLVNLFLENILITIPLNLLKFFSDLSWHGFLIALVLGIAWCFKE